MVDGLSVGAGYAHLNNHAAAGNVDDKDQDEGTAYVKYSVGALSLGAQRSVVNIASANTNTFHTDYVGISYAISDNLSVSYNEIESTKESDAGEVEQDMDSISISYTMGGMTLAGAMNETDNMRGVDASDFESYEFNLSFAF